MKPLLVIAALFLLSLGVTTLWGKPDAMLSGRIAMSGMLLFAAMGHFKFTTGMMMMLPRVIAGKRLIILTSGFLEIAGAAGILIPATARLTGSCLIMFFILILPSNIYAAIHRVNYEKADHSGRGLSYLWFRIPFQLLLILWVYFFVMNGIHRL